MSGENQPNGPIENLVLGYPPRYVAAVRALLGIEGGHANDPLDRGGETRFGISLRFLKAEGRIDLDQDGVADFDLDFDGDIDGADIRLLTKADAAALYWRYFWQPLHAALFPGPIGEMMFDQAVNGGLVAARKLLQRAINQCFYRRQASAPDRPAMLKVDGLIGTRTKAAFDWVVKRPALGMSALVVAYRDAAAARYRAIVAKDPGQRRFLAGWLSRVERLGKGR